MIQIITRIKYPELYRKMQESARATAKGPIMFTAAHDDGQPKIADSYNLLGITSMADILLFVHDDVIFMSEGWDEKVKDALALGFNVVGVVGSKEYNGGMVFDSGREHSTGRICGIKDGKRTVRLFEHRAEIEPVKVVDGLFMAVTREHFIKTLFDESFDGLFFYDTDFCLRSNCAVVDILVSHEKPDHLRGVYPSGMRPIFDYSPKLNRKYGFPDVNPVGDQSCEAMLLEDYLGVCA